MIATVTWPEVAQTAVALLAMVAIVCPFPVLEDDPSKLVRPPSEWGTLVQHPRPLAV